ncbi:MAG: DUF6678 family protein [Burkholderiaceae bacterium]
MPDKAPKPYSRSFMSNAKWRKLFAALNVHSVPLNRCVWKLVGEREPYAGTLPDAARLGPDYVGDCGALNGPFAFRDIEWLFLPARVGWQRYAHAPTEYLHQDVARIQALIDGAGRFEYELGEDGLRIYGYKP